MEVSQPVPKRKREEEESTPSFIIIPSNKSLPFLQDDFAVFSRSSILEMIKETLLPALLSQIQRKPQNLPRNFSAPLPKVLHLLFFGDQKKVLTEEEKRKLFGEDKIKTFRLGSYAQLGTPFTISRRKTKQGREVTKGTFYYSVYNKKGTLQWPEYYD